MNRLNPGDLVVCTRSHPHKNLTKRMVYTVIQEEFGRILIVDDYGVRYYDSSRFNIKGEVIFEG